MLGTSSKNILVLGIAVLFLFRLGDAFQSVSLIGNDVGTSRRFPEKSFGVANLVRPLEAASMLNLDDHQHRGNKFAFEDAVRDKLREAIEVSLTPFRAVWRTATGITLTAVYATALAASGLWIRNITSLVLSIFPAWFRYFLQPFLIAYYLPVFIIRGLTGPTRRQAKARHEAAKQRLRDAIEFTKSKGDVYRPVAVNDKGYFELVSTSRRQANKRENMADAVAASFERAMDLGYHPRPLST